MTRRMLVGEYLALLLSLLGDVFDPVADDGDDEHATRLSQFQL